MRTSGAPDPEYVLARRVLLDALDALEGHRASIVLVGAQAIYLHTGAAEMAVAEHTTDADLAVDPRLLQPHPLLAKLLEAAKFRPGKNPGTWLGTGDVAVDLLVPESLGGRPGHRGARLPPHGDDVARQVKGIEATLVDHSKRELASLEPYVDQRAHMVEVAGPAGLLVAKLHKIADRADAPNRLRDKDALDVLRLLQAVPTDALAERLKQLSAEPVCAEVTRQAIEHLGTLFAAAGGVGADMAARAAVPLEDPDTIRASCRVLAGDLLAGCDGDS